jgi:eukaryotic-like serine/threonine-protein kinase
MTKVPPDKNDTSWESPTLPMEAGRFENISGPTVPRAKPNVLGIGSIVGSYRFVEQIGCGSMGMVYEAVHTHLELPVAIKVLHASLLGHLGMDTRMLQEAAILDELDHPGATKIFDSGRLDDRRPWIAMELVTGESLASKLSRVGTLAPVEVCNLIAAIADVLATAHPLGIIHRDLKPENVLFAEADTGFPLRVIDWGVARLGPVARLTLDGVTCGTPIYMSPEQMKGCDIAPACDIYSLGVIAYEAVCGTLPFDGRTLADLAAKQLDADAVAVSDLAPTTPRALCELIHSMLARVPGDRPSAVEVRQLAQRIALEVSTAEFESYSVSTAPWPVMTTRPIDHGVTEHPAVTTVRIRRPRWTPEISFAVAGEISNVGRARSRNAVRAGRTSPHDSLIARRR